MTKWLLLAGDCVGVPFGVFSLDPDNGPVRDDDPRFGGEREKRG